MKLRPKMTSGITVNKFPRRSFFRNMVNCDKNGMKRTIKFDPPFVQFYWTDPNGDDTAKKVFSIKNIIEVIEGKRSINFEKYPNARKELCFSILMVTRTIDLQCDTEEDYMNLLSFLKLMMIIYGKFETNLFILECLDNVLFDEKVFDLKV